jgi:hypothetical protein
LALPGAWRRCLFDRVFLPLALQQPSLFFSLSTTTIVGSVVTSAAAALKLLLWSDTLPGWVRFPANHTPRSVAAVPVGVFVPLAAFAL